MFVPFTERIDRLAKKYPKRIEELENFFDNTTAVYIDFANVARWQDKLGWHIDLKRLKQLFKSFDTIKITKFYYGTLLGDAKSQNFMNDVRSYDYDVVSKAVKIIRVPINVTSIPKTSPDIIQQFISMPLLKKLNIETIKFLNERLKELNQQGIMYLEHKKCNFDVEIGSDILVDYVNHKIQNFILWTGDSDFADLLTRFLSDNKKCVLFATARKVSKELNELRQKNLLIFDIKKIRDFICWKKEIS